MIELCGAEMTKKGPARSEEGQGRGRDPYHQGASGFVVWVWAEVGGGSPWDWISLAEALCQE